MCIAVSLSLFHFLSVCMCVWVFFGNIVCSNAGFYILLLLLQYRYVILFALLITHWLCVADLAVCCFASTISCSCYLSLPLRVTMCEFIAHFYSYISHFIFEFIFDERKKKKKKNWRQRRWEKNVRIKLNTFCFLHFFLSSFSAFCHSQSVCVGFKIEVNTFNTQNVLRIFNH